MESKSALTVGRLLKGVGPCGGALFGNIDRSLTQQTAGQALVFGLRLGIQLKCALSAKKQNYKLGVVGHIRWQRLNFWISPLMSITSTPIRAWIEE